MYWVTKVRLLSYFIHVGPSKLSMSSLGALQKHHGVNLDQKTKFRMIVNGHSNFRNYSRNESAIKMVLTQQSLPGKRLEEQLSLEVLEHKVVYQNLEDILQKKKERKKYCHQNIFTKSYYMRIVSTYQPRIFELYQQHQHRSILQSQSRKPPGVTGKKESCKVTSICHPEYNTKIHTNVSN